MIGLIQTLGGMRMLTFMRYGRCLSCVAAFAMVATPLMAAEASNDGKAEQVFDVTISKTGTLVGQVLNASGQPQANADVAAVSKTQVVSKTKTNARGVFQLPVTSAGVYRVALADRAFTVRAWQADLAPPAAKDALLCVTQEPTVRGQCGGCGAMGPCGCGPACPPACGPGGYGGHGGKLASILTNPVVIGLGVATAIALPIALDDDDDDDNGGNNGADAS